jgi:hypothetical protein
MTFGQEFPDTPGLSANDFWQVNQVHSEYFAVGYAPKHAMLHPRFCHGEHFRASTQPGYTEPSST